MTVEYYLHFQDYVAQCLNLDKPDLNCNGTCILMQKMQEVENQKAEQNLQQLDMLNFYVYSDLMHADFRNEILILKESTPFHIQENYLMPALGTLFQPPIA